jgi:hypothetical protein
MGRHPAGHAFCQVKIMSVVHLLAAPTLLQHFLQQSCSTDAFDLAV